MEALRFIGRVLTFRFTAEDIVSTGRVHLAIGLLFTWLAGIGRYWDSPRASVLQRIGLGSIAYVFVLATFLWLLLMPLRPKRWTYLHLVAFIAAVSPPALLYAIPVERFLSLQLARDVNFWFLAVVAAWRVALYITFLRRYAAFDGLRLFVSSLLPLLLIIFALTALNLEHAVFNIMAGVDPHGGTSADSAYAALAFITMMTMLFSPIVLLMYFVAIYVARKSPPN